MLYSATNVGLSKKVNDTTCAGRQVDFNNVTYTL